MPSLAEQLADDLRELAKAILCQSETEAVLLWAVGFGAIVLALGWIGSLYTASSSVAPHMMLAGVVAIAVGVLGVFLLDMLGCSQ